MKGAAVSQIAFEAAHMHAINFQSFLCPPFCERAPTLSAHTMESDKKWRQSDDPPSVRRRDGGRQRGGPARTRRHDLCGKSIKPQEVGRKSGRIWTLISGSGPALG